MDANKIRINAKIVGGEGTELKPLSRFHMALHKKDLHKPKKTELEELLVFGYSCKLFRDDEKAQTIDEGQHLIPWMGQDNLKIDRYDARGTLYDLARCEAPPGGYDRFIELTETEKILEVACDEERYRSLHTNEEEDRLYKEEEQKRQEMADGKTYGQVEYKYSENMHQPQSPAEEPEVEDDRPFKAPPVLDIPVHMPLPATMKHNAVIEKTAMFISSQGAQMEIILKAKQAGNPLFDFLTFGNALHGYYRLVLGYIKSGRYVPCEPEPEPEPASPADDYLHPSLLTSRRTSVDLAPIIHSTSSQGEELPNATVYSELLVKLKEKAQLLKRQEEEAMAAAAAEEAKRAAESVPTPAVKDDIAQVEIVSVPPPDIQLSISKMASYAAKNGRKFETVVKNKKDTRFQFLESSHVYHEYYLQKIVSYQKMGQEETKPKQEPKPASPPKKREEVQPVKVTPICFAIKPKEAPCVMEKSALPLEDNSDEEGDGEAVKVEPEVAPDMRETCILDLDLEEDDDVKVPTVIDKQLQLERKRKVSAFLKSLNVKETPSSDSPPRTGGHSKKKSKKSRVPSDKLKNRSRHRP